MQDVIEAIHELFSKFSTINADRIEKLPQSGSDRIYYRIFAGDATYIATSNHNQQETITFIAFSKHFKETSLPV